MGARQSALRGLALLATNVTDLKGRTSWGYTELPKTKSPPWIVAIPGGGMRDRLLGAQNQDRSPDRAIRTRHAAVLFVIYGKDYDYIEAVLHELIAVIQHLDFGRSTIGDPIYVSEDQDALSKLGEHFRLPVFYHFPIAEAPQQGATEAVVEEIEVQNAGVSENPSIPSNLGWGDK